MDALETFIEGLSAQPMWKYYMLGTLALILALLILWESIKQPSQMLAFATERGRVFISRRAICEMIGKVAGRTFGVVKCHSRLKARDGKLEITLKIHMRADADLREIQRKLELQVTDVLNRNLGFNSIGAFTTKAVSVVGDLADLHPVTRTGLKSEAELFGSKQSDSASDASKSSILNG